MIVPIARGNAGVCDLTLRDALSSESPLSMRQTQLKESMNRPLMNSYWVIPGRLLAGEYPIGLDCTDARVRLAQFREAGINFFIDLTEPGELPAYRHLLPIHTKYK